MKRLALQLGKRLKALRERAGLTQEEAAERIGVHPYHLRRLEHGRGNPTLSTLFALGAAYGVELRDLFAAGRR